MPVPWELLAVRNVFVTSSVLIRRTVLDRVGEFDTRLQGPEDHDLWLRVAEVTRTGNLDVPLTGYRDVPGSLSKQPRRMEEGMLRIIAKLGARAHGGVVPGCGAKHTAWSTFSPRTCTVRRRAPDCDREVDPLDCLLLLAVSG